MREEKGYIYIIEDEPGICKIGKSHRFPSKRAFDCECEVCKEKWEKAQAAIDAIYTRVPIDMLFDIPKPTNVY